MILINDDKDGPSKAACIHLTRLQASKLMPEHITVNVICPGVFPSRMTNFGMTISLDVFTKLWEALITQAGLGQFEDLLSLGQPSGRIGVPADFAGTVLYLSSAGAAHMTGNVIELDGGSTRSGLKGKRDATKQKL
jgi:NAD(P)-dependent dehydrogenase (short-subunit alcohol dehydrogenase family)